MTQFTIPAPASPTPESREERQIRLIRNRMRLRAFKAAEKQQKAMLAVHKAAGTGRNNRDWRASTASADAAIIPEVSTLNARARQLVRDSWIGKSVVKAFSRNVVGCGVLPIPMAKDKSGKPLTKLNQRLLKLFWAWANSPAACDVERRQTFWQKQSLMVEERVTVGEAMLVWSYTAPTSSQGPVGLRVQSFESEQFDLRLQSYRDPATGITNQVRGGVEVDSMGAPVAYHFYTRNPNDYLPMSWNSVRIPAARVLHLFKQERVLQTRGVTAMAPILQDTRDLARYKDAALWRAIMEACIGVIIKQDPAATGGSPLFPTVTPAPGTASTGGTTSTGMQIADMVPGMVAKLLPNETAEPFIPQAGGLQYEPFTKVGLRGVGAGVGLSYSQVARQSESNYSAARQDMLEDRKEFEPEQEMLAHIVVLPIWGLFVRLAVLEGKLDDVLDSTQFYADSARFCEAEYVAPAAPWIDPQNEANAYEKLLKLKVMDREEVAALRGKRLTDIFDKIEAEQKDADARGIALPEEADDLLTAHKRLVVEELIKAKLVQVEDQDSLDKLVAETGLPKEMFEGVVPPPPPKPFNGVKNGPLNGENGPVPGKNGVQNGSVSDAEIIDLKAKREAISRRLAQLEEQKKAKSGEKTSSPPHYRDGDEAVSCATCSFLAGTQCNKYGVPVELTKVCDSWEAPAVARQDDTRRRLTGPYKPDGQPEIDAVQSPMTENPGYGKSPDGPAGISS